MESHVGLISLAGLTERQRQARWKHNSISYTEQWGLSDQEILQHYRDCDMVVFASTYEGFGMPIIEGNATGRPVVTSNICSMPEVAGAAACLVDPFDCSSIRERACCRSSMILTIVTSLLPEVSRT